MEKQYNPETIERTLYEKWEKNEYFEPSNKGESYSLMIPPPNVTGSLHMGHAFQISIMDAIIRYKRMMGHNTLWQVGTDHAGIATQMLVERKMQQDENQTRHDVGRDNFLKKIWDWKKKSGNRITEQLRSLGASVAWKTERFTMDEGFSKAVQKVFISLYKDDLIYRGKRLVNWDPVLHTAISDLEVENKDVSGKIWHIRYKIAGTKKTLSNKNYIVIATTRPETILGDTAVAINPEDTRYTSLIGESVILPLTNRKIPIIADTHADIAKGTGCVKITPAHDFDDYQVGQRNQLPMINIFTESAEIRTQTQVFDSNGKPDLEYDNTIPTKYQCLDRFAARKQILADLEEQGHINDIKDHELSIPYGDRSGVIIEPLLTDQWFVRAKPLAEPAIDAVKHGKIQFIPENYQNMFFSWMDNIQDWCISRQLWWGHRIPAWYDDEGNHFVGEDKEQIYKDYNIHPNTPLHQDEDVLDTWFSSALWTFATLGWPDKTTQINAFHPTSLLVTGFDIIFFWVARMIMMTIHIMRDDQGKPQIPFHKVYVHGLVRDQDGQKMSKSKGNVIDPLDLINGISLDKLIEKRTQNLMQPQLTNKIKKQTKKHFPNGINAFGTDALRFTLYSLASTGRDIKFDMGRLEGYKNFCNKIWNASRYVAMNTNGFTINHSPKKLNLTDKWILSELQTTLKNIHDSMEKMRLDLCCQYVYEYIWSSFCDWYIELSKPQLKEKESVQYATKYTLVIVMESILRMAHPLIPFITEQIWMQQIKDLADKKGTSIMLESYPLPDENLIDDKAERSIKTIKSIIMAIRTIRNSNNIHPGKLLPIYIRNLKSHEKNSVLENMPSIKSIARVSDLTILEEFINPPSSAMHLAGEIEVIVLLSDLFNKEEELARLAKEIEKIKSNIKTLEIKLSSEAFVTKAPTLIVNKEKNKLSELNTLLKQLTEQQLSLE